ncbi:hypothetical protein ACKKBG_A05030 [Auxenochlorella protothecoides x Auxenochlorella symbiontica]
MPPLLEPPKGPFTTADIVAAEATVRSTHYEWPVTQATIPTERVYDAVRGERRMFRTSFHRKAHTAIQGWLSVECFRCACGPGKPEGVEKDSASQREGRTSLSRRRSKKTGCQHTFTIEQLRQDSKKSIVFYPGIGQSGHSDTTFQCQGRRQCSSWSLASAARL